VQAGGHLLRACQDQLFFAATSHRARPHKPGPWRCTGRVPQPEPAALAWPSSLRPNGQALPGGQRCALLPSRPIGPRLL